MNSNLQESCIIRGLTRPDPDISRFTRICFIQRNEEVRTIDALKHWPFTIARTCIPEFHFWFGAHGAICVGQCCWIFSVDGHPRVEHDKAYTADKVETRPLIAGKGMDGVHLIFGAWGSQIVTRVVHALEALRHNMSR